MPAKRKPTFADIVSEVLATPPTPLDVRAGTFNAAGQFFDPAGTLLARDVASITPAEAAALVGDGALIAFEGCGCGGYSGCTPEWLSARDGKPEFVKGYGSPTWIDRWSGESTTVVFLHGDVQWG